MNFSVFTLPNEYFEPIEFTIPGDNNVPQNAIGFQLLPGAEVTMVVSKTGDRYRLQSDCFEAIGLLEVELVKRLSEHYHDKVNPCGGDM